MSILFRDGERVETSERVPLEVGDCVKVHLPAPTPEGLTESPWADVVELLPNGRWLGRISNPLTQAYSFDYGDCVAFERMSDGSHWWWEMVDDATPARPN